LTSGEWLGIGLLVSSVISMLAAWKWELAGALVSLACLVAWALVVRINNPGPVIIAGIPSCLYLVAVALNPLRSATPH
jgi:hypothetical protein